MNVFKQRKKNCVSAESPNSVRANDWVWAGGQLESGWDRQQYRRLRRGEDLDLERARRDPDSMEGGKRPYDGNANGNGVVGAEPGGRDR